MAELQALLAASSGATGFTSAFDTVVPTVAVPPAGDDEYEAFLNSGGAL